MHETENWYRTQTLFSFCTREEAALLVLRLEEILEILRERVMADDEIGDRPSPDPAQIQIEEAFGWVIGRRAIQNHLVAYAARTANLLRIDYEPGANEWRTSCGLHSARGQTIERALGRLVLRINKAGQ